MQSLNVYGSFDYLIEEKGLIIPYGAYPQNGEKTEIFTEQDWNKYQWNPPQNLGYIHPDPTASPKPTWQELLNTSDKYITKVKKDSLCYSLDLEATKRVGLVYHDRADQFPDKEWNVRLSGIDLTSQNAERVRLVSKYHEIKTLINEATTVEQLEAIDISNDASWSSVTE